MAGCIGELTMVRQRRELRLTERMATAGLVDTIPIRPATEG